MGAACSAGCVASPEENRRCGDCIQAEAVLSVPPATLGDDEYGHEHTPRTAQAKELSQKSTAFKERVEKKQARRVRTTKVLAAGDVQMYNKKVRYNIAEEKKHRFSIERDYGKDLDDDELNHVRYEADPEAIVDKEIALGNKDMALLLAAHAGADTLVERTVRMGANAQGRDDMGLTVMYFAMLSRSEPIFHYVLAQDGGVEYSAAFFDSTLAWDGMTHLMLALLHGLHGIYEYLLDEYGCKMQLLGPWGVETSGKYRGIAPLDKWLEFLPELTLLSTFPRPRYVSSSGQCITFQRYTNLIEPEEWIADRFRVRSYIRNFFARKGAEWQQALVDIGFVALRYAGTSRKSQLGMQLPQKQVGKRNALTSQPESEGLQKVASEMDKIVAGTVVLPEIKKETAKKKKKKKKGDEEVEASGKWLCGQCSHEHEFEKTFTGDHIEVCEKCSTKNWIFVPQEDAADPQQPSVLDTKNDQADEVWANDGTEFASEKIVAQRLKPLLRSNLRFLDESELRKLASITQVVKMEKGSTVYEYLAQIDTIHVLVSGQVELERPVSSNDFVEAGKRVIVLAEERFTLARQAGTPPCYDHGAKVVSDNAVIFVMSQHLVEEYSSYETLMDLIYVAVSRGIVNRIDLFNKNLSITQCNCLAQCLEFTIAQRGATVIQQGRRCEAMTIITEGTIRITDDGGQRALVIGSHIDKDPEDIGKKRVDTYIYGIRGLMYCIDNQINVSTTSAVLQLWKLKQENMGPFFDMAPYFVSLSRLLQVAAYINCVHKSSLFSGLDQLDPRLRDMLVEIQTKLDDVEFEMGETVLHQGDVSEGIIILGDGTIGFEKDGRPCGMMVANADANKLHCLGELALLTNAKKRTASIIVKSALATVLVVKTSMIDKYFGSVDKLLEEQGTSVNDALDAVHARIGIANSAYVDANLPDFAPIRV